MKHADQGPEHSAEPGRLIRVNASSFIAKRERRGAKRVEVDELMEQSEIVFQISENDIVSELCIECMEFMASASRNAAAAVDVLERLDESMDPHLLAALRKYVEDTGLALKEVDNRLKNRRSSLTDLFPEFSDNSADVATWRSLIGRRDVIAHRILSVDDMRVREEANRDFKTLYSLLRNINFVPTMIDWDSGRIFAIRLRAEVLRRLPAVDPGSKPQEIGTSVILVCEDIKHGLLTFRVARSPQDTLLFASTRVGSVRITVQTESKPSGR